MFFVAGCILLEEVATTYSADAQYIFGHSSTKFGVTGKKADLLVYTRKRSKAGESKEKIVALDNLRGFPDYHVPVGPQNRLPENLSVADDELTS